MASAASLSISQNKEDYLRALFILNERHGIIRSSDVAQYLEVSKPSVSEMMRKLGEEGLVSYERYSSLALTARGRVIAEQLTSKHRLIETFLEKMLHRPRKEVHHEAHRLEHAFSDESIAQLRKLLGNPSQDPHGSPIPKVITK